LTGGGLKTFKEDLGTRLRSPMLGIRLKHTTVVNMEQNETVARETV